MAYELAEYMRIASYLAPVPFMSIWYWKYPKLNKLSILVPVFAAICTLPLIFLDEKVGFLPDVSVFYVWAVALGFIAFRKKGYDLTQALSVAFCLAFFASFFWEIPVHIYTLMVRGTWDLVFALNVFYIMPLFFAVQFVRPKLDAMSVSLLMVSLGTSLLSLATILETGFNIWTTGAWGTSFSWVLWVYVLDRTVACVAIFYMFLRGRKVLNNNSKN